MEDGPPVVINDAPSNDFSSPEEVFKQRCRDLISTQCQRAIEVVNEGSQPRPVTLEDFKLTLEKSLMALNVSILTFIDKSVNFC